jgi:HK97 family phage prohead protease
MTSTDIVRAVADPLGFRQDRTDDRLGVMSGQFSTFGDFYEINSASEGRFLERFVKGAFADTMRDDRAGMRILFNHGTDPTIGSKVLGVIEHLQETDQGAEYRVSLFDTAYNRDLLPGLRSGQYGASMRFSVVDDSWNDRPGHSDHNPAGLPERTITRARVREFGPVSFGANPKATAAVRSRTDEFEALRSSVTRHEVAPEPRPSPTVPHHAPKPKRPQDLPSSDREIAGYCLRWGDVTVREAADGSRYGETFERGSVGLEDDETIVDVMVMHERKVTNQLTTAAHVAADEVGLWARANVLPGAEGDDLLRQAREGAVGWSIGAGVPVGQDKREAWADSAIPIVRYRDGANISLREVSICDDSRAFISARIERVGGKPVKPKFTSANMERTLEAKYLREGYASYAEGWAATTAKAEAAAKQHEARVEAAARAVVKEYESLMRKAANLRADAEKERKAARRWKHSSSRAFQLDFEASKLQIEARHLLPCKVAPGEVA